MKRTPAHIAWRQLFTARRFFNMSRLTALKARQAVSENFLETRTHGEFDHAKA